MNTLSNPKSHKHYAQHLVVSKVCAFGHVVCITYDFTLAVQVSFKSIASLCCKAVVGKITLSIRLGRMDTVETNCASKNYGFYGIYDCSGSHHHFHKLRVIPHAHTKDTHDCTLAAQRASARLT